MIRAMRLIVAIAALMFGMACSTTEEKPAGGEPGADSSGGGGGQPERESEAIVSSNRVTLTNSLSNNPLTSQTINRGKAEAQIDSINGKDKRSLEGKASAMRLAGKSGSALMGIGKKIAELEMEKAPNKEIDAALKLEIALAAITSREFTLAYYFLEDLSADKKAPQRVRAGAYNALGVIALKDERIPEAVVYFRQALQQDGNYKPAKLNLAFVSLKGGSLAQAKQLIGDYQSDWFAQYGMISIERMEGDTGRAADLCQKVLDKEKNHKAALFNCALLEAQNKRNFKRGIELAGQASRARGGETGWDERIQGGEREMQREMAAEKAKAPASSSAPADGAKDNKPANSK